MGVECFADPVKVRVSRQGNYISVTARMEMHSSYEIIALYKAAAAARRRQGPAVVLSYS